VPAGKLAQVTNFTIALRRSVHGFVLFARGDTAMPGGLHARPWHVFLVYQMICRARILALTDGPCDDAACLLK